MFPTVWLLRSVIPAVALTASALVAAAPASGADLGADYKYGARPVRPYGLGRHPEQLDEAPIHGRVIERRTEIENCRLVVRRRVNKFGEEVLRQARVCEDEEPVAYRRPRLALPRDVDRDDTFGSPELVPPADIPYEEDGLR